MTKMSWHRVIQHGPRLAVFWDTTMYAAGLITKAFCALMGNALAVGSGAMLP